MMVRIVVRASSLHTICPGHMIPAIASLTRSYLSKIAFWNPKEPPKGVQYLSQGWSVSGTPGSDQRSSGTLKG